MTTEVPTQPTPTPDTIPVAPAQAAPSTPPVASAPAAVDAPTLPPVTPPAVPEDVAVKPGAAVDDYETLRKQLLSGELPATAPVVPETPPPAAAAPTPEPTPAPVVPPPAAPVEEPPITMDHSAKKRRVPTETEFDHLVVNLRNSGLDMARAVKAAAEQLPDSPEGRQFLASQAPPADAPAPNPPATPALPELPKSSEDIRTRLEAIEMENIEAFKNFDMAKATELAQERILLNRALPEIIQQESAAAVQMGEQHAIEWERSLNEAAQLFPDAARADSALTVAAREIQQEMQAKGDPIASRLDSAPLIYAKAAARIGYKPAAAAPVPAPSPQPSAPVPAPAPQRPPSAAMIAGPQARTTQPGHSVAPDKPASKADYEAMRKAALDAA